MSNTYSGWNLPDPDPDPEQGLPVWDPYGPRDPYGRPANPYGRPDYQPRQQPEQPAPQPPAELDERYRGAAPVTVGDAWRWAWSAFGASWGTWVLMSLLVGIGQVVVVLLFNPAAMEGLGNASDPAAIEAARTASRTIIAQGIAAGGTAVGFLLQAFLYAGALTATRTRKVTFRSFFALRRIGGLVGCAVLTGALAFMSTTVPVVGWLVQVVGTLLLLPVPFLLLSGLGFGGALVNGVRLVLANLGTALAVFGIFAGLVVASVVTCGIGLVVVMPAMLLVGAYLVQLWTGETVRGPAGSVR